MSDRRVDYHYFCGGGNYIYSNNNNYQNNKNNNNIAPNKLEVNLTRISLVLEVYTEYNAETANGVDSAAEKTEISAECQTASEAS